MKKLLPLILLLLASCNIPQIEDAKCTVSRETVRSFYSQHLAEEDPNGITFESIAKKAKFLTPELNALLQKQNDPARAFMAAQATGYKIGECKMSGENTAAHTVRLFAKIDNKPVETEMSMMVEKHGDQWLISDLINEKNESLTGVLKK